MVAARAAVVRAVDAGRAAVAVVSLRRAAVKAKDKNRAPRAAPKVALRSRRVDAVLKAARSRPVVVVWMAEPLNRQVDAVLMAVRHRRATRLAVVARVSLLPPSN